MRPDNIAMIILLLYIPVTVIIGVIMVNVQTLETAWMTNWWVDFSGKLFVIVGVPMMIIILYYEDKDKKEAQKNDTVVLDNSA